IAAAERDDAEGAAMVAAVLHLHEAARVAGEGVDVRCAHRACAHDVGHGDAIIARPYGAIELILVAEHAVDLGHGGELRAVLLRGAAGDDNASIRLLALEPADRLPRLAHRFAGHRAGVDEHRIGNARGCGRAPHRFRFHDVETAAEGDDIDAHGAGAFSNNCGLNVPLNSNATGPVISTWSSLARHSMVSSPPGSVTCTLRSVRLKRAAATAVAQAAEPQARVKPAPRSHVRMTMCSRSTMCASVMLARSGKIGWFSKSGPKRSRS